jgi:hypothetical protein
MQNRFIRGFWDKENLDLTVGRNKDKREARTEWMVRVFI